MGHFTKKCTSRLTFETKMVFLHKDDIDYNDNASIEQTPLLESGRTEAPNKAQRGRFNNKTCLCWCFLALAIVLSAIAMAVYFIFHTCSLQNNCVEIKFMALNTWGMPERLGSLFKTQRMDAIAEEIAKGRFDVYLLEELWMQPDHNKIAASVPTNYSITGFRQLSSASCDGRVLPTWCSGLAIISRYPFKEVEFNAFADHGDATKMFVDGEWFARKGVGRVQVEPMPNVTLDIFVTHTAADPEPWHGYNNSFYREKQVRELLDERISKSKADVVVLGGDFNDGPKDSNFEMIRYEMQNSIEELFYKLSRWLNPEYSTYGNPDNTFTGGLYQPVMYDYIFRRTNFPNKVKARTYWFELPLFKTKIAKSLLSNLLANNVVFKRGTEPCKAYRAVYEQAQTEENTTDEHPETAQETAVEEEIDNFLRLKDLSTDTVNDTVLISFSDHEAVTSTIYIWT